MPLYFLLLTVCQSSDVCSRKEKLHLEGKKNKLTREKKWQLHKELVKKKKKVCNVTKEVTLVGAN